MFIFGDLGTPDQYRYRVPNTAQKGLAFLMISADAVSALFAQSQKAHSLAYSVLHTGHVPLS